MLKVKASEIKVHYHCICGSRLLQLKNGEWWGQGKMKLVGDGEAKCLRCGRVVKGEELKGDYVIGFPFVEPLL